MLLEAQLGSSDAVASKMALKRRIGELQADGAEIKDALRELRSERERAPQQNMSELFVRLQGEINRLEGETERLRSQ